MKFILDVELNELQSLIAVNVKEETIEIPFNPLDLVVMYEWCTTIYVYKKKHCTGHLELTPKVLRAKQLLYLRQSRIF